MNKLNFPSYSLTTAEKDFEELKPQNLSNVDITEEQLILRERLLNGADKIFEYYNFDAGIKEKYKYDLSTGLLLYQVLVNEYKFGNRTLSDDDFWRYLSVRIIPELVHVRWEFNENRFYKDKRRMFLKTSFWYIEIGWQGSIQMTYDVLKRKNFTTDTVVSLVERPGLGYNKELYREILRQYADIEDNDRKILRKIMVLNTARLKTINPELIDGGVVQYVKKLFEDGKL